MQNRIWKNVSGQKVSFFALDSAGAPVSGDAANNTATISKDAGTFAATNDANPTEVATSSGCYVYDLTQAETNCDLLIIEPASSNGSVDTFFPKFFIAYPTLPFLDDGTATFDRTTDSLQALRDNSATLAQIQGAIADILALENTTIATLASQTSFTLTDGAPDNDAYPVNSIVIVRDATTADQLAVGQISDYVGSTKTVTLSADPGVFTMAVGDKVQILPVSTAGTGGDATAALQTQILDRIGSFTGSGVNTILGFLQSMGRSDASVPSDMGGTYTASTDSLEAIRNITGTNTTQSSIVTHLTDIKGAGWNAATDSLEAIGTDTDATLVDTGNILIDTADMQPKLGSPAGASISADIAAVPTTVWAAATRVLTAATNVTSDDNPSVNVVYEARVRCEFGTTDRYTVTFLKNRNVMLSGVTSPTISVTLRNAGTSLFATQALTQIGSTGRYKYDEATNVVAVAETAIITVNATLDGNAKALTAEIPNVG